jgi:hypothetical protein
MRLFEIAFEYNSLLSFPDGRAQTAIRGGHRNIPDDHDLFGSRESEC